jgi:hypothetical protein
MRGVKQLVLSSLVIAGAAIATGTTLGADDTVTGTQELTRKVRRALERLPYYGVYDFLAFKVEPGVITLEGYAHRPSLKKEAETMIRHAAGVDVANKIEILPSSTFDDQIRWTAFQRIYTDEFADRYVSGGTRQVQYDLGHDAALPRHGTVRDLPGAHHRETPPYGADRRRHHRRRQDADPVPGASGATRDRRGGRDHGTPVTSVVLLRRSLERIWYSDLRSSSPA